MSKAKAAMAKKVAAIARGAAGLISAKTMAEAGFDVTVFELGSLRPGFGISTTTTASPSPITNLPSTLTPT
jgi:ribulose 1,5-bisphosphate synthetase/thiazole synthase